MEISPQMETEERIRRILISRLEISPNLLAASNATTHLLGHGIGLDSMETLTLAAGIEEEFDIHIPDEDLTVELFKNIATLGAYVLQKVSEQKKHAKGSGSL
jgi:acyl carrier protein